MRCDVRTLPPQTAAVGDGDRREPSGILTGNVTQIRYAIIVRSELIALTCQWDKTTSIQWNVHVEHRAHAVDDRRVHDGDGCVEVSADFAACSRKVEMC